MRERQVLDCAEFSLHQNYMYWPSHTTSLEQFLRAIWSYISKATVLILCEVKVITQLSYCTCFLVDMEAVLRIKGILWIWILWISTENISTYSMVCAVLSHFSHVWLLATLWTVACYVSISMGLSRQEYWSGLPFSSSKGSSIPRVWVCVSFVSCIGRQVLHH